MDILSLGLVAVLLAGIFVFCGWVVKRHFVDRRWWGMGRQVYAQWQNGDEQERIEYVMYVEDEEKEEAEEGPSVEGGPRRER